MDNNTSASTSDSGVQTPIKRRKLEEKNTKREIIDKMLEEVGKFGGPVSHIIV